jgi:hypothetical protein
MSREIVQKCDICQAVIPKGPRAYYANEDENLLRVMLRTSHAITTGDGATHCAGTKGVQIDRDLCLACAPNLLAALGMNLSADYPLPPNEETEK